MYIGHNLTFEDQIIRKDESIPRILFQNVEGLELISHGYTLILVCDSMRQHSIDSASLCEINTLEAQFRIKKVQ